MRRSLLLLLALLLLVGCTGRGGSPAPPESAPVSAPPATGAVNAETLHSAGMKALAEGRYADASAALGKVAEVRGSADDWNDFGYALGKQARWAESAEACGRAVKLDSRHAYALYNLGWAEYKLGQFLPARTHIGQSEAFQKQERWETRYALGLISEALGEKSRAAVDFEAAAGRAKGESDAPAKALERLREWLPLPLPAPAGWTAYTNARFGFRVFAPAGWKSGRPPDNGDGLSFTSPDGKSTLAAWGGFHVTSTRLQPGPQDKLLLYGWVETDPKGTAPGMRSVMLHAYRWDEKQQFLYGVHITAPAEQWADLHPTIDTVLRSFRITFGNAYVGY